MKKVLTFIGLIIIDLIITFVLFEGMSWYHFGDIPTPIVLIRLIVFFCILLCLTIVIYYLIKKRKNK